MFEFIPDGLIAIGIVVFSITITYLMQRRSIEYLLLKTKQRIRRQLKRQACGQPSKMCPNHPQCPMTGDALPHFQSSAQHQERETNRTKREPNQE